MFSKESLMNTTPRLQELQAVVAVMKSAHLQAPVADAALRADRLQRAERLLRDHQPALSQAMSRDFGHRAAYQSLLADGLSTMRMLSHAAAQVAQWMQPEPVAAPAPGMQAWIQPQPLGVVGIMSPWNFPINLAFGPLAGVFAAGNTALIKPSELTPRTSELIAELVGRYFQPTELGVVLGGADVGAAFSGLPFDHLVFTGSTQVGRHVMRAAAENLVPVTLELGGKSPVVVDPSADLDLVMQRTLTVKTFNAGQICLAPDYLLLTPGREADLVEAARRFMATSFPSLQANEDYTNVINERHFARLSALLADATAKGARVLSLAPAGEPALDVASRKIAPHLVLEASDDMQIMQEEIFGPLLPVKTVADLEQAIAYINARPRPLAAYLFSPDEARQQDFAARTTSGALVFNDVMTHSAVEALPFGGVGASGMGAYHGIHGFRRFSHAKAVVRQSPDGASGLRLRAPYADKLQALQPLLG